MSADRKENQDGGQQGRLQGGQARVAVNKVAVKKVVSRATANSR